MDPTHLNFWAKQNAYFVDVISPVSGEVIEVNSALEATPEIVNEQPFETWFYRVKPTGKIDAELAALLAPEDYEKHMDEAAAH